MAYFDLKILLRYVTTKETLENEKPQKNCPKTGEIDKKDYTPKDLLRSPKDLLRKPKAPAKET